MFYVFYICCIFWIYIYIYIVFILIYIYIYITHLEDYLLQTRFRTPFTNNTFSNTLTCCALDLSPARWSAARAQHAQTHVRQHPQETRNWNTNKQIIIYTPQQKKLTKLYMYILYILCMLYILYILYMLYILYIWYILYIPYIYFIFFIYKSVFYWFIGPHNLTRLPLFAHTQQPSVFRKGCFGFCNRLCSATDILASSKYPPQDPAGTVSRSLERRARAARPQCKAIN